MRALTIGVDVDGVIYDLVGACREHFAHTYGLTEEQMPATTWNFWKEWAGDWTPGDFWREVHGNGLTVSGRPEVAAQVGLEQLSADGHRIHIITARNPFLGRNAETAAWLVKNGVPFNAFTMTSKAGKVDIPVDVMIEDHYETALACVHPDRTSILFDQPWNAGPWQRAGRGPRCVGWDAVLNCISALAVG